MKIKMIVAVAALLTGLTACGNRNAKSVAETVETAAGQAVTAVQTQAREVVQQVQEVQADSLTAHYRGSDGLTRKVFRVDAVFYPQTMKARISVDGKVYRLEQYPTASGFGYRNAEIDFRGKGTEAELNYTDEAIRDLTLVQLTE